MTPEQARVFLDHIKGDRNEALSVVALALGLRVSEVLAVSWDDPFVDYVRSVVAGGVWAAFRAGAIPARAPVMSPIAGASMTIVGSRVAVHWR